MGGFAVDTFRGSVEYGVHFTAVRGASVREGVVWFGREREGGEVGGCGVGCGGEGAQGVLTYSTGGEQRLRPRL